MPEIVKPLGPGAHFHPRGEPSPVPPPVRRLSERLRVDGRSIPLLAVSPDVFRSARLDHRAGFLVSLLDGATDLESLLDVCSMPVLEALQLLDELVELGFVVLQRPPPRTFHRRG